MNSLQLSVFLLTVAVSAGQTNDKSDNRPLIGVLMQECSSNTCDAGLFIAASYVKYLESAGSRVVPVFTDRDQTYYEKILNVTNGMLFPGGGQSYSDSTKYTTTAQMIWNLTYGQSAYVDKYPIWGTCLGFELLVHMLDPNQTLADCNASNLANDLTIDDKHKNSRMFKDSGDLFNILKSQNVTWNHHQKCLLKDNLTNRFNEFFEVLSTNKDVNGLEYVSTVEAKDTNKPVFGVQWHPEKNQFEFSLSRATVYIPHSADAVRVSQYMANFFVNQARQRTPNRQGLNAGEESDLLIYNYKPLYSGKDGKSIYTQIYVFNGSQTSHWLSSVSYLISLIVIAINGFRYN